jgi:hypothetical protein
LPQTLFARESFIQISEERFQEGYYCHEGATEAYEWDRDSSYVERLKMNTDGNGYVGFGTEHNWTHICGLWDLPYVKALILMHNIDLMHQVSDPGPPGWARYIV